MKIYKLIFKYFYQYKYFFTLSAIFVIIFTAVFSLYDLEIEGIFYASLLCGIILAVIFPFSFYRFCKKHKERQRLLNDILIITDDFPKSKNLIESDYIEIIDKLLEINHTNIAKYLNERTESVDYYTTWVHQIKTPISIMKMILQSEDTDEHRELLAELFRIEQYAEMALNYIRLDSNSSDFVFKNYDLDRIVREAVRKFAPQFIRKRISLKYEPVSITVLTDEKWLQFIIEQLLSNAIKYTEKGSVTIKISDDKILSISDTGIGIAPEDLPRIFEKGFTGYNGRTDKKSTGLGLYLCKKTAYKLSHKISVESEINHGSTFFICFS